jgi:pimeloyl-ACP methyl ester carboxylesterase
MTDRATWRDPRLGEAKVVSLPQGELRCHDTGTGTPIVFAHGLLVNANLWREVVARLAPDFRCLALDLPLGSHLVPMREDADLSPTGLADLIAGAMEALGLEDATLVGNDTGGGLCQIAAARRPERLGRLVLTSCDAFDNFPPKAFRPLKVLGRAPASLVAALAPLRVRRLRRLPLAFGWLTHRPIDPRAEDSYVLPSLEDSGVRRDVAKVLVGLDPRHTLEAAERLRSFERPALVAWSRDDRFCPPAHGERLAALLPQGRLEWVEGARTFSPEDRPDRLAELIAGFVREPHGDRAESR